jgi:hypothetical protein
MPVIGQRRRQRKREISERLIVSLSKFSATRVLGFEMPKFHA